MTPPGRTRGQIPRVELVYFTGCPHAEKARRRLREALALSGLVPEWREWDTKAAGTPGAYQEFASPTVLVDGRAVGARVAGGGVACAVGGAPAVSEIVAALW